MSEEIFEKTFSTSEPATLYLSNIRGKIEVISGAEGEIQVTGVKHLHTGDDKNTEIIIEQEHDGRVRVETHTGFIAGWLSGSKPCEVDYLVRVPKRSKVEISNVSSSCQVGEIEGEVRIKSVSGELSLSELSGKININTVSGNIRANNLHGELNFNSVSGNVKINRSRMSSINGKTVSGEVLAETPLSDGPYKLNTVSGNLHMRLAQIQGLSINVSSISGVLRTPSGITHSRVPGGSRQYDLGGGGPLFQFNSISGDFIVETQGNGADFEPTPVSADRPTSHERSEQKSEQNSDKTMEVLQMIEDGKISVEEGLELLKSLE